MVQERFQQVYHKEKPKVSIYLTIVLMMFITDFLTDGVLLVFFLQSHKVQYFYLLVRGGHCFLVPGVPCTSTCNNVWLCSCT